MKELKVLKKLDERKKMFEEYLRQVKTLANKTKNHKKAAK